MDSAAKPHYNLTDINNVFKNYYQDLYTSSHNPNIKDIHKFLNNINLPQLTSEQANSLEQSSTTEEFYNALHKMPNNKAPRTRWLPCWVLQTFLVYSFFRMIDEIFKTKTIPSTMNTALTVTVKTWPDPTLPTSYRPLSLINTDKNHKALTDRIEKVITSIIDPDQTGFIKGRQSSHNTRKLLNLMQHSHNKKLKTIILSQNAQKAFDRVDWKFLFATLQRFGFGESFINWVRAL